VNHKEVKKLVEKIFAINIQAVFKNLESENENIASLYVLDRKELSIVITKQKQILAKAIEKAKENLNGYNDIEHLLNMVCEVDLSRLRAWNI